MRVETLASGVGFVEGPVYLQDGDVAFTSIDQGRVYRVRDGSVELAALTGGGPNGATEGTNGDIYIAQNGGTRPAHRWPFVTGGVQVVRQGGKVDWLTQDPISPNDLCFGPDGFLYVTDPTRGSGRRDDGRIWRCDAVSGEAELLRSIGWYPNGIGFGLEDDALYVASTGQRCIWRFPLGEGRLGEPEIFTKLVRGMPDGFAFDDQGSMVVAAVGIDGSPGEVQTYDCDGRLVDAFSPGSSMKYTNLAISEDKQLIVTDADAGAVLSVSGWPHAGMALHPFRRSTARG